MREIDHAGHRDQAVNGRAVAAFTRDQRYHLSLSGLRHILTLLKSTTSSPLTMVLIILKIVGERGQVGDFARRNATEMFINADSACRIERCHAQHFIQRDAAMRDQSVRLQSWLSDEPLNANCHPHTSIVVYCLPAKMNCSILAPRRWVASPVTRQFVALSGGRFKYFRECWRSRHADHRR